MSISASGARVTGHPRPAEHRWAATLALAVVLTVYVVLPGSILGWTRYVVIGMVILLVIPVIILNPHRLTKQTPLSRWLTVGLVVLITTTNQVALVLLVRALVVGVHPGPELLLTALEVWGTNVIGFALLYWELDRGGPVDRHRLSRGEIRAADFRFPQDEDHDATPEVAVGSSIKGDWVPHFVDYLYVSLTNSMAFSPTDTMPLTHRAKLLMGLQSAAGFVILALVIARSVNILA
jgi:hypothetical protein